VTETNAPSRLRFLSAEYFAQLRKRADTLPEIERANADVQYTVGSTPIGTVQYYLRIRRGRIDDIRLGVIEAADLDIGVDYGQLVELNTGAQHAAAALMKGILTVSGDRAKLLDLMLTQQTAGYQKLISELSELTRF
jgi:SCP-2 sterol transfer family